MFLEVVVPAWLPKVFVDTVFGEKSVHEHDHMYVETETLLFFPRIYVWFLFSRERLSAGFFQ